MVVGRLGARSQSQKPKSQKQTLAPVSESAQPKPASAPKQSASTKPASIKSESAQSKPVEQVPTAQSTKPAKKQQSPATTQAPVTKSESKPAVTVKSSKPTQPTTQSKKAPSKAPAQPKQEIADESMSMDESDDQADVDMKPQSKVRESRAARRAKSRAQAAVDEEMMAEAAESANVDGTEERGVVYLGRLPHGMFEKQLRTFLVQFGEIKHVHLGRNKKTGKSKHYAFIEFEHAGVAEVVADAMHRYMMYGHTIEAHVVPSDKIHPDLFKHADRGFRYIPYAKIAREQYNKPRTTEEQQNRINKLLRKEEAKRQAFKSAGINFDFPGFRAELTAA